MSDFFSRVRKDIFSKTLRLHFTHGPKSSSATCTIYNSGSDDTGKYKSKKSQGRQHSDNKAGESKKCIWVSFFTVFLVDGRDYTRAEPEDSYDYYSSEECDPQVFHCDEPEEPAYLKLKDHCKGELLSSALKCKLASKYICDTSHKERFHHRQVKQQAMQRPGKWDTLH